MKKALLLTAFLFSVLFIKAQCDISAYNKLISEGNYFANKEQYEKAVKKYSAAIIACPDKAGIAQQKIVAVFNKIEKLKDKAEENEEKANLEKQKAQNLVLAATAREQLSKDPTKAIRLAELAWKTSPTHSPYLQTQRILSESFYLHYTQPFYKRILQHNK